MRFFTILAITAITFLPMHSASAQINPSIGDDGGLCWADTSGNVSCWDVTSNTSLGGFPYGVGGGGIDAYENLFFAGNPDTTPMVQIRDMDDNSSCEIQGTGKGRATATHIYVAHGYQDKLVKIPRGVLNATNCSNTTDIMLSSDSPVRILKIGDILYILNQGSLTNPPSIDEVDTANNDAVTSHTFGAVHSNDVKDMAYDPGTNSFIVTHDAGLWSIPRGTPGTPGTWTASPWGDVTNPTAQISYLDGYIVSHHLTGNSGYVFDPTAPSNETNIPLVVSFGATLGHVSGVAHAFYVDSTGLRVFDLAGTELGISPLATGVAGMVNVKPWNTPAVCNNGVQEGTEDCDTLDLGGETCQSRGYLGGTLACDSWCIFDESGCYTQLCQNGIREGNEDCDGSDLGSQTCQMHGFAGGTLNCTATCTFDTSNCNMCGNSQVDSGEDCDGGNLNGETCQTQGFDSGTLACNGSCGFDTSGCIMFSCGNGNIEGTEDCDGANLGNATCITEGFASGTLACESGSCAFDTSGCSMCGNDTVDGTELCDGADLNGRSCTTEGFDGGTLTCTPGCASFNTSGCTLSTCGNGVIENNEACDDNNTSSGDGCSSQCQVEDGYECLGTPSTCTLMCGNQAIDGDEECDGQDFGTASCSDFGFDSGTLSCTSSCTIDTSGCLACNQDGLVQELGSGDFDASSQLQGELMTKYEEVTSSLQSQALEATCEQEVEIFGAQVPGIVISVNDQHYVHFRVETEDFVVDRLFFSYFGAAELAVSTDNPLEQEIYGDGDVIFIHSGENITVKRGWNATGTVGTIAGIFSATYNRRQKKDGWFWEIVPQTDMVKPFEFGNDLNSIIIGTDDSGLPYYLDKANAHDLSEIGRRPGGGGCNQANCSQSNGAASLGVMFGILMLWLLLGLRRSRRSAPSRIKENDRKSR